MVEQGTHQELLEKGGLYYSMWIEQAYLGTESDGEDDTEVIVDEEDADAMTEDHTKLPPK